MTPTLNVSFCVAPSEIKSNWKMIVTGCDLPKKTCLGEAAVNRMKQDEMSVFYLSGNIGKIFI